MNNCFYEFACQCNAGRTKLKHWPMLGHSPGERACPNISHSIDSHAEQEISCVNGGEGGALSCVGRR